MGIKVVLDTNIFLNVKNRGEPYYESLKRVLDAIDDGRSHAVVSVVSIAELCASCYIPRQRGIFSGYKVPSGTPPIR